MGRFITIIIIVAFVLVPACDDPNRPEKPVVPDDIMNFVNEEGFPGLQSVHLASWGYREVELFFFIAEYGRPLDCPLGCIYSSGYGLKYGEKIGWMKIYDIYDHEGLELSQFTFYDIEPSEVGLFHEVLWKEVEEKGNWLFWFSFLPMIARDLDTPEDALVRIAGRLYGFITASLAWDLLERQDIEQHPTVLQMLACLPEFQGDAYELPRERAREILGDSFLGCSP